MAEKIDKFNLTDALTNENKQSQIGEKYSALRRGVDSDVMEDMTASLTDYMMKQFSTLEYFLTSFFKLIIVHKIYN